jgi:hypothetical protein
MLLARLLHFFGGILLVASMFAPVSSAKKAAPYVDVVLKDAYAVRYLMDMEFSAENVWMVESTALLAFCDLSMLQFMPWKKSRFFTVSEGYPSMRFMKVCMGINMCQTIVSVICEISYIALYSGSMGSTATSAQADILFAMNIIFGVVVVAMDLVIMCVRGEILSNLSIETKTMRADAAAQDGVILEMSDVYKGGGDGSIVSSDRKESGAVEEGNASQSTRGVAQYKDDVSSSSSSSSSSSNGAVRVDVNPIIVGSNCSGSIEGEVLFINNPLMALGTFGGEGLSSSSSSSSSSAAAAAVAVLPVKAEGRVKNRVIVPANKTSTTPAGTFTEESQGGENNTAADDGTPVNIEL